MARLRLQSHSKAPVARAGAVVSPFTPLKFTGRSLRKACLAYPLSGSQPALTLGSIRKATGTSGKCLAAFT